MKEYNEQVVETLDDAGCIIANKNIIIDNFQARIAELEGDVAIERASRKYWEDAYSEWINTDKAAQGLIAKDERIAELEAENERLKEIEQTNDTLLDQLGDKNAALLDEVASQKHCYAEAVAHYEKQLAASQAYAEQLRVAIDRVRSGAAALGLDRIFDIATEALALPRDTSALDAHVAKRLHDMACDKGLLRIQVEELTRQRDLAVEALERWGMFFGSDAETAVLTIAEDPSTLTGCQKATKEALSAIKESEWK